MKYNFLMIFIIVLSHASILDEALANGRIGRRPPPRPPAPARDGVEIRPSLPPTNVRGNIGPLMRSSSQRGLYISMRNWKPTNPARAQLDHFLENSNLRASLGINTIHPALFRNGISNAINRSTNRGYYSFIHHLFLGEVVFFMQKMPNRMNVPPSIQRLVDNLMNMPARDHSVGVSSITIRSNIDAIERATMAFKEARQWS